MRDTHLYDRIVSSAVSCGESEVACSVCYIFTFSHFADAFIQSDLQLGNT